MVGIGIITHNRLEPLKKCLESVLEFSSKRHRILVADDGSTDGTLDWLEERDVERVTGTRGGVARNKNRALWALKDCDSIILIEDDAVVLKRGWVSQLVKASRDTGEQHFCLRLSDRKEGFIKAIEGHEILYPPKTNGFCMFFTKRVLRVCGGFHQKFGLYGSEHGEFSSRISLAGLTRHPFPHLVCMNEFVGLQEGVESSIPEGVKRTESKRSREIEYRSLMLAKSGSFRRPFNPVDLEDV